MEYDNSNINLNVNISEEDSKMASSCIRLKEVDYHLDGAKKCIKT